MANVAESTSYDAGIYQLEIADLVLGGTSGISNTQAKGLANRTNWLKSKVNTALRFDSVVNTTTPYVISSADVSKLIYIGNMGNSGFTFPDCASFPQGHPFSIMASDLSVSAGVNLAAAGSDKFFDGTNPAGTSGYTIRSGQRLTIMAAGTQWYITGSAQSERNGRIPAGVTVPFGSTSAPLGWIKCNGSAVSRTLYADLFAVIGITWGYGDGLTTFNVPDYRGVFIRGLDEGAGIDSGRSIGIYQADQFASHTHQQGADVYYTNGSGSSHAAGDSGTGARGNTLATGGSETRPKNNASPFIIKY